MQALNSQQSVHRVNEETLLALQHMLDAVNPYVNVFCNGRDVLEVVNVINLSIHITKANLGRQYTLPIADKVIAFIVKGDTSSEEHRDIIVYKIGGNLQ